MKTKYIQIILGVVLFIFTSVYNTQAQIFTEQKAEMEFAQGNYSKALKLYEELHAQDKSGIKYLAKIGESQFFLKQYAEAEKNLGKYLEKNSSPVLVRLRYAQAMLYQGKYEGAKQQLIEFKNANPSENLALAELLLKNITFATNSQADTNEDFIIYKSDIKIGGLYLGGNPYRDALVTTIPQNPNGATPNYKFASFPFGLNKPYSAITYTDSINSKYFVGSPTFSNDLKTMYFTMNVSDKESAPEKQFAKSNISRAGINRLNIYSANLKDGKWTDIQPLPFCTIDNSDTHPSITQDGKFLFFSSNRPGGFGGYDIYYVKNEGKGKWSVPMNAGGKINSAQDELNPFALGDSLLYFSSNGRIGYGGADIYYTYGSGGKFSDPINMGPGFNSFADDFGISFDTSMTYGVFASNRDTKEGVDEIWYFERLLEYISGNGNAKDKFTLKTLPGVNVSIFQQGSDVPLAVLTSDANGSYAYDKFEPGKKYMIRGEKEGYLKREINVDPAIADMNRLDLMLDAKLKKNDVFTFNDILFEYDKATLLDESIAILNKLANLLSANSGAVVELSAHTDSRGSDSYNEKLSQRRAESCVNYLVSVGVNPSQIIAKGYGERKIKNRCTNKVTCSEEEHLLNRRVEIKVLDVKELSSL